MTRPRKQENHLPPCVYLKHGSYWYVKKGKWEKLGTELGEALEEYALRHEQPAGGVADLIDRAFEHHRKVKKLSDETVRQYRTAAKILKRKLSKFGPRQVKPRHMLQIQESLATTPNMANRVLSFSNIVFKYAVRCGEADFNPCRELERLDEATRQRYLTHEEFSAIYAKAGPRLQVIMDLQYLTGQRINDVLTLRRSKITEAGIRLKPKKTKNSTGVEMLLKWTPELREAVERAKALSAIPAVTLLRGRGGKAPNYRTVAAQFAKAAKAANVQDARPNDQRAKSATDANNQGKNPQALLGHSSASMTARYLRQHSAQEVEGPSFRSPKDSTG